MINELTWSLVVTATTLFHSVQILNKYFHSEAVKSRKEMYQCLEAVDFLTENVEKMALELQTINDQIQTGIECIGATSALELADHRLAVFKRRDELTKALEEAKLNLPNAKRLAELALIAEKKAWSLESKFESDFKLLQEALEDGDTNDLSPDAWAIKALENLILARASGKGEVEIIYAKIHSDLATERAILAKMQFL